jgi:UDP-3-O-[3-hydroxymyristoyl] glucosamine N-acyltransferase
MLTCVHDEGSGVFVTWVGYGVTVGGHGSGVVGQGVG